MRRLLLAATVLTALTASASPAAAQPRWEVYRHVQGILDMAGPRADGRFVVASGRGLRLLGPGRRMAPFAPTFPDDFFVETHLAVAPARRDASAGCSWRRDTVYAVAANDPSAVQRFDERGRARRFAVVPGDGVLSGIAFDRVGDFDHRLLVTRKNVQGPSSLLAVDCRGRARAIATGIPPVEGGMEVAPRSFGRFAGQLMAPDELSGKVVAFRPDGRWSALVPPLPAGDDVGVEGVGFVPPGFGPGDRAYLADRAFRPPFPGTQSVLVMRGGPLLRAGVRPGDLLVATESGALTARVRCGRGGCSSRRVAAGPPVAHAESAIVFGRGAG